MKHLTHIGDGGHRIYYTQRHVAGMADRRGEEEEREEG